MSLFALSHSANSLGKGVNPTILLPAMGKLKGRLTWQPV